MKGTLQSYRRAVKEAIEESWAAGLPVFQIRKGYLVAVHPGGRVVKLKKVSGARPRSTAGSANGAAKTVVARRT
jgi:hypothetical protein